MTNSPSPDRFISQSGAQSRFTALVPFEQKKKKKIGAIVAFDEERKGGQPVVTAVVSLLSVSDSFFFTKSEAEDK